MRSGKMYIQRKFLSILVLCSVAVSTQASFYKCIDPNGKTIFSDKPCGKEQQTIKINQTNTTTPVEINSGDIKYSNKPDLLVCPGGHGTNLPAKLCNSSKSTNCQFETKYLKNVITDLQELKNELSDPEFDVVKKNLKSSDELWEFGTPGNEWDSGTGIRGYVVMKKLNAVFYMAVLHQGYPNYPPNGSVAYLPKKGPPKKCKDRNIMDREF